MDEKFANTLIYRVNKEYDSDGVIFVYDDDQPIRFGLISNKQLYPKLEKLIVNWGGVVDTYKPNTDDDFNVIIGYEWEDYNSLPDKVTSFQYLLDSVREGKALKTEDYSLSRTKRTQYSEKEDKIILKAIEITKGVKGYDPKEDLLWESLEKSSMYSLYKRDAKSLKSRYNRQLKDSNLNIKDVKDEKLFNFFVYLDKQGIKLEMNSDQVKSSTKTKGKPSSSQSKDNKSREVSREKSKTKSREVSREKSKEKAKDKNESDEKNMSIDLDEPETQNPNVLESSEDLPDEKENNKKKAKSDKSSKEGKEDSKLEGDTSSDEDDEKDDEEYIEDSQDKSREYGSNKTLHDNLQKNRDNSLSISPISRKRKSSESPKRKTPKKQSTQRKLVYQESFLSKNEILDISLVVEEYTKKFDKTPTEVLKALYVCNGNVHKIEKYLQNPDEVKHWTVRDDRCIVNQEYKKIANKWSQREIEMRKRWLFQN